MCTSDDTIPELVCTPCVADDGKRVREESPTDDETKPSPLASTAAATRSPGSLGTSDVEGEWQLSPRRHAEGTLESLQNVAERAKPVQKRPQVCSGEQAMSLRGNFPYSLGDLKLIECFYTLSRLQDPLPDTLKLLLRAVMLLRSCGYCMQDICVVLAHASIYFNDAMKSCGKMAPGEAGNILALLMYLAHSYVQDETCPLRYWHLYLFTGYCSPSTLDKALMCMMKLRGYTLRVEEAEMQSRFIRLHACTSAARQ